MNSNNSNVNDAIKVSDDDDSAALTPSHSEPIDTEQIYNQNNQNNNDNDNNQTDQPESMRSSDSSIKVSASDSKSDTHEVNQ